MLHLIASQQKSFYTGSLRRSGFPFRRVTEEEADALDEYFTKNLPKVDPGKGGITTRQGFRMVALDRMSEDYLLTMAIATKKTPTELIGDMVREKLAVAQ